MGFDAKDTPINPKRITNNPKEPLVAETVQVNTVKLERLRRARNDISDLFGELNPQGSNYYGDNAADNAASALGNACDELDATLEELDNLIREE